MDELTKINPSAKDCRDFSGGGAYGNYSKQEILLGCVGSKPQYTALLIAIHTYTSRDFVIDYKFTLSDEIKIISDCKKQYKQQATMLLRSKSKRKPLHDDEIAILARCAICCKVENKQQDKHFAEYLGVSVGQFVSKYRSTLDQCFILIEKELQEVVNNIYRKLGY